MPKTLFDKIWDTHQVTLLPDYSALVLVDRIFLHERTGSIALTGLEDSGRSIRSPEKVFCTMDHIIDTFPGRGDKTLMPNGTEFITTTRRAANSAGIRLFDINDPDQGISHLISAEQGITLPGLTIVCPDSHTCTLGALGAIAWGIGSSDCEHALATDTLRVIKPKQMRVELSGETQPGIYAKDIILTLIRNHGNSGGEGMAIEFCGSTVENMSMDERFTLCNMATEFSAFTAVIAPDKTTIEYIAGKTYTPKDQAWQEALQQWENLKTDQNASFDEEISLDCSTIEPMISWGTSPEQTIGIRESIPKIGDISTSQGSARRKAITYVDLSPNQSIVGTEINGAFIGSCTNGRLSDLKIAAEVLKGKQVNPAVKAVCTPGSAFVKREAERLGLDRIFLEAGFEWREPGCSLCFYAGGEGFNDKERIISTTNRNFQGRQGRGARTHIASPAMVAAAAIAGKVVDCRDFIEDADAHLYTGWKGTA